LCDAGFDVLKNVAALCPNCHRKMHILNVPGDVKILKDVAGKSSIKKA
jgi:5-methylcytosine-specific restriction protein A